MNIISYKIPCRVFRVGLSVEVEVFEDQKVEISKELVTPAQMANITGLSKEIGNENYKQRLLVQGTILTAEKESKGIIVQKILSE